MKRAAASILALILILSGMHLTLATHLCGGQRIGATVTFGATAQSCCKKERSDISTGLQLQRTCCDNHLSTWSVDTSYYPTPNGLLKTNLTSLPFYVYAYPTALWKVACTPILHSVIHPPGRLSFNAVELPRIGVFRI